MRVISPETARADGNHELVERVNWLDGVRGGEVGQPSGCESSSSSATCIGVPIGTDRGIVAGFAVSVGGVEAGR